MKLTGIAYIKVGSDLLQSLPGASLDMGGEKRDPVTGHAVYGYAVSSITPGMIECTCAHGASTPVQAMRDFTDGTVVFECDSGPSYQVTKAWLMEPPKLTDGDGKITFKFCGDPATEI